jgi:pantoate--beta-alanine ligase
MKVLHTIAALREYRATLSGRVALVPTMGALHAGHVALMEMAGGHGSHVGVTIFVNPTQFGPREDFHKYPRPIEADLDKCERAGVDFVFNPSVEEMYPVNPHAERIHGPHGDFVKPGFRSQIEMPLSERHPHNIVIDLPSLTNVLEGVKRPGHFKGVCQVVAKLFNVCTPHAACFGQKDYQQLRVISAMVEALNWPIEIVECPTVREPDGLAMSSRNQYLSPEDRRRALSIVRALRAAEEELRNGFRQTIRLVTTAQRILLEQHLQIDYVATVDPHTFTPVPEVNGPTLMAIAARVGITRLIDNVVLRA